MNPAPTLLNDWVTTDAFLAFIGFFAFATVVWMATEFIKRMHAAPIEQTPAPKVAPQPRECQMTGCPQPATHLFVVSNGYFYTCARCATAVREWTGPYDHSIETVYDQELDCTDLALWEKEL